MRFTSAVVKLLKSGHANRITRPPFFINQMQHHRACRSKLPIDADWLAESAARGPGRPQLCSSMSALLGESDRAKKFKVRRSRSVDDSNCCGIEKKNLEKKTKLSIAIDIGTMTTGTPGATQSLRPTAPRMLDVAAIGKKRASEKILSPA